MREKERVPQIRMSQKHVDILLRTFLDLMGRIHHQIGVTIKWQLFKGAIIQVMKDYPEVREEMKSFFGDVKRNDLSPRGEQIFNDLIAIRNAPHTRNRFHRIFVVEYKSNSAKYASEVHNTRKFRKFIANHKDKVPGLFELIIRPG